MLIPDGKILQRIRNRGRARDEATAEGRDRGGPLTKEGRALAMLPHIATLNNLRIQKMGTPMVKSRQEQVEEVTRLGSLP
jgi:hypothetical protein